MKYMEMLNIISEHIEIFVILIGILILNFFCIIYLIIKERKDDKAEINEIMDELNIKEEPKKEIEEKQDQQLEQNKREVEEMLMKMQKDLEAKPEDAVASFENEQEEKSIISYQELLDSVKNSENVKVTPVKIEEEPEKIEIDNFKDTVEEKEDIDLEKTIIIEDIDNDEKKFKGTDFISPIFGRQENNFKYPTVPKRITKIEDIVENTKKSDKIEEPKLNLVNTQDFEKELRKNDDFLKALKDFRKSLD